MSTLSVNLALDPDSNKPTAKRCFKYSGNVKYGLDIK